MVEGEAILHQRNSFAQSLLGQVTKYRAYNEAARPCKQGLGLLIHTASNRHLQRPAICLSRLLWRFTYQNLGTAYISLWCTVCTDPSAYSCFQYRSLSRPDQILHSTCFILHLNNKCTTCYLLLPMCKDFDGNCSGILLLVELWVKLTQLCRARSME